MPRKKKDFGICHECDIPFEEKDAWLQCGSCQFWYHRACVQLSDVQFTGLVEAAKQGDKSMQYFCALCKDTVNDVLTNIQRFKKMQNELNSIRNEINGRFENLETQMKSIEEKISKGTTVTDIKSPSFREILKKDIQKSVKEKVKEELEDKREAELIEEKKNNIVLFNVPESLSEDCESRMRHDRDMFLTLYNIEENDFADETVKVMHRVGSKEAKKPRPMVVKFINNEDKAKYLKDSGDLALSVDGKDVQIYATNDRTRKQRETMKNLTTEIKERRKAGEEDIVIRNFRIIKKKSVPPESSQKGAKIPRGPVPWNKLFWKKSPVIPLNKKD